MNIASVSEQVRNILCNTSIEKKKQTVEIDLCLLASAKYTKFIIIYIMFMDLDVLKCKV